MIKQHTLTSTELATICNALRTAARQYQITSEIDGLREDLAKTFESQAANAFEWADRFEESDVTIREES